MLPAYAQLSTKPWTLHAPCMGVVGHSGKHEGYTTRAALVMPALGECPSRSVGASSGKQGFPSSLPAWALRSDFPDTAPQGRGRLPCPHHPWPAAGPETWLSLCWGLSSFSLSLARAGIAASFILSQRPGPAGPAVSEFLWLGGWWGESLTSFSPAKHRGLCGVPACGGHCASSSPGERPMGDSALGREGGHSGWTETAPL